MKYLVDQMKADWNRRAEKDPYYFVAFGKKNQDIEAFLAGATDVINRIRQDLARLSSMGDATEPSLLEIGCGVGRLIYFLHRDASSITGVDISDEMILRARDLLKGISNVYLYVLNDNNLSCVPSQSINFIYSYAVFQHLPSRHLMLRYLDEARRVIRSNGIFLFQANTAPVLEDRKDTWVGEWVSVRDIINHLKSNKWRILAVEGSETQYTWITASPKLSYIYSRDSFPKAVIDNIYGLDPFDSNIISGGPLGFMTAYVYGIPEQMCDIVDLHCTINGKDLPIIYIGAGGEKTWRQLNIRVPSGFSSGTYNMSLSWHDHVITDRYAIKIRSRPNLTPKVVRVTDGEEIGINNEVHSEIVQVTVSEIADPHEVEVKIAGVPLRRVYTLQVEPLGPEWIISFDTTPLPVGPSTIEVLVGDSKIYNFPIEIFQK